MALPLGQALESGGLDCPLEKHADLHCTLIAASTAGKVTVGITSHHLGTCPALCRQIASLLALAVGRVEFFLFCAEK